MPAVLQRPQVEIEVEFDELHPGQQFVSDNRGRFTLLCAGRRWRKTSLGVRDATETALEGGAVAWLAPAVPQGRESWDMLTSITRGLRGRKVAQAEKRITYGGRGYVQQLSGYEPDSLRGGGYDLVVLDEPQLMDPSVWYRVFRPALMDRKGRALFCFTPAGRANWMYDLWCEAGGPPNPEGNGLLGGRGPYRCFRYPSHTNPYLDPEELDSLLKDEYGEQRGSRDYRQEILAEFLLEEGTLFNEAWFLAVPAPPSPVVSCVRAWDLGGTTDGDWTVGVKMGKMADSRYLILDVQRFRMTPGARDQRIKEIAFGDNRAGGDPFAPPICPQVFPQDPGQAGLSQVAALTTLLDGLDVRKMRPTGDKEVRARPLAAQAEHGNVLILSGLPERRAFLRVLADFPGGLHDDDVDAAGDSHRFLAEMGTRELWAR